MSASKRARGKSKIKVGLAVAVVGLVVASCVMVMVVVSKEEDGVKAQRLKDLQISREECRLPLSNRKADEKGVVWWGEKKKGGGGGEEEEKEEEEKEEEEEQQQEIWGLVEALPVWEIHRIFGTAMTRECLRNKKVLFLGDSTMNELAHELALLLANVEADVQKRYVMDVISGKSHNLTSSASTAQSSSWKSEQLRGDDDDDDDGGEGEEEREGEGEGRGTGRGTGRGKGTGTGRGKGNGNGNGKGKGGKQWWTYADVYACKSRNMTVHASASNTQLRYRFTGHHNLSDNREGIAAFFNAGFQEELESLLVGGEPDIIVVNSGLHDEGLPDERFEQAMRRLAERLHGSGAQVLWKGNVWMQNNATRNQELQAYDQIARREFTSRGMHFVNVSHVVHQLYCNPQLQASDIMPVDNEQKHYGPIMYYHNPSTTPIIGAHITQAVLNAMCLTPP